MKCFSGQLRNFEWPTRHKGYSNTSGDRGFRMLVKMAPDSDHGSGRPIAHEADENAGVDRL